MRLDGEVWAANGYLAIRCNRGAWIDSEFPEAWTDFRTRVEGLPWARWDALRDDWRALDAVRGTLFRKASLGLWLETKRGWTLAPSPVVLVCGGIPCRLSMLQLIARLPRCEVYTGPCDRSDPLWFRFSGGRGLIAHDRLLTTPPAFSVFEPRRDCLSGQRVERQKMPPPRLRQPGVDWPPADMTDAEETTHFID